MWDDSLWDGYSLTQENDTDTDIKPDEDDSKSAEVFSRRVPPNASDPKSADSLIASQMAKLSVADREKVYMDVHAIPDDCVVETPELIQKSLRVLQHEIDILPDKKAYNIAERLSPKYTQDREFRLAFLRCEKFECQKAALRFVRHFQVKLDLFGQDMLTKDITQDDLDVDDMECLYLSNGRFLNAHDKAGRRINMIVMVQKTYRTVTVLRKGFYTLMTAYRDLEIQRRGFVTISIQFGDEINGTSADNADLVWKLPKLNEAVPLCLSATHLCYTKEAWDGMHAMIKTAFSKANQVRCRVHCGPILKCLEELRRHGIDPSYIPVNHKGEITDLAKDRKRIEQQRRQERLKYPTHSTIALPFCEDVLLGKGTPFQIHHGNKKLQQFVTDRFKKYERAQKKGEKKAVAQEIMDVVRGNGGLFLKQDGNKWAPVTDDVALMKVGALFRYLRLKNGTK